MKLSFRKRNNHTAWEHRDFLSELKPLSSRHPVSHGGWGPEFWALWGPSWSPLTRSEFHLLNFCLCPIFIVTLSAYIEIYICTYIVCLYKGRQKMRNDWPYLWNIKKEAIVFRLLNTNYGVVFGISSGGSERCKPCLAHEITIQRQLKSGSYG